MDQVAEWLRRWTANPMGSARVSSNLILVDCFIVTLRHALRQPEKLKVEIVILGHSQF